MPCYKDATWNAIFRCHVRSYKHQDTMQYISFNSALLYSYKLEHPNSKCQWWQSSLSDLSTIWFAFTFTDNDFTRPCLVGLALSHCTSRDVPKSNWALVCCSWHVSCACDVYGRVGYVWQWTARYHCNSNSFIIMKCSMELCKYKKRCILLQSRVR